MGTDCAQCHTVLGWNNAIQQVKDHQNRFPLFGAHAAVQCEDCHKGAAVGQFQRSEEHTSELQSQSNLVCRLLLEKKKHLAPRAFHQDTHLHLQVHLKINDT